MPPLSDQFKLDDALSETSTPSKSLGSDSASPSPLVICSKRVPCYNEHWAKGSITYADVRISRYSR